MDQGDFEELLGEWVSKGVVEGEFDISFHYRNSFAQGVLEDRRDRGDLRGQSDHTVREVPLEDLLNQAVQEGRAVRGDHRAQDLL